MAIDLYKGFTNIITGETFKCISFDSSHIRFEWIVEPGGYVPFEHVHMNQDEIFFVKEGELKMLINGRENIVRAGEQLVVPRGKKHIAFNNKPSRLHCLVDYRPGLDSYTFFQCFGGLTLDMDVTENGSVNIPKMLYFTRKMRARCLARPASLPAPLLHLALNVFYLVGSMKGWKKDFKRYTGIS